MIFIDMITINAEFLENMYNPNTNKRQKTTWFFCLFLQIKFGLYSMSIFSPNIYIYGSIAIFRTFL